MPISRAISCCTTASSGEGVACAGAPACAAAGLVEGILSLALAAENVTSTLESSTNMGFKRTPLAPYGGDKQTVYDRWPVMRTGIKFLRFEKGNLRKRLQTATPGSDSI